MSAEPEAREDADVQVEVESAEPEDDDGDDSDDGDDGDATENSYERKQAARVRRLNARADALQAAANTAHSSAKAKADRIPFGQPILVGHHSEGRDRRFRSRIDSEYKKSFELQSKADELRRRAQRAEKNDAISSDDPDAIKKLEAKVDELERQIDRARDINEAIRAVRASHKRDWEPIAQRHLIAMGIPPNEAERLTQKDFAGRVGAASYVSKNSTGEIARLNRRIEELKRRDARPVSAPVRIGDAVVTEDREANRVQIRFDGIPTKEMRSSLRARGFVWAPSIGVWQRKLTDNASWAAKQVLRDHYGPNAVQTPETARQPGDDAEDDAKIPASVQHPPGNEQGEGDNVPF